MKFVSALIFLLNLLALPTAAGETAHAKNEGDPAYSDVSELFESLARKSEKGQFKEAAELGVQAREFVLSSTLEDSIERAQYFFSVAQLLSVSNYRRREVLLDFSEQALTLYSRINEVPLDTLLKAHSLHISALIEWSRWSADSMSQDRLEKAIRVAEKKAKDHVSRASGDLFVTMSRAANSKRRAKKLLNAAVNIYSLALGQNAGLTLFTRAQAARQESEKTNARVLLEILPLFKKDNESLQFKAAAQQQLSVLFLKQGNDNQSLEQNIAAYETLKELGIQREFNAMDYTPVIKENAKYPSAAARRGVSGYVILEYAVTKTGAVEDISVIDSKPTGIFDEAAIEAAQKYRYMPRIVNGKPIDVPGVRTRITFEI